MKTGHHLKIGICVILFLALNTATAHSTEELTRNSREFTSEGSLPGTCWVSDLGALAAEASRAEAGTELAILPASAVNGTLKSGAVFESDLALVIANSLRLWKASVTPAELKTMLEVGVSRLATDVNDRIDIEASCWDAFPQTAGFSWTCDVSAPIGERIVRLSISGTELDLTDQETQYSIAAPLCMLDGSLGYPAFPCEDIDIELLDAMRNFCAQHPILDSPVTEEAVLIGTTSISLYRKYPVLPIVLICIAAAGLAGFSTLREKQLFSFEGKNLRKR